MGDKNIKRFEIDLNFGAILRFLAWAFLITNLFLPAGTLAKQAGFTPRDAAAEYGINCKNRNIRKDVIKCNENLTKILAQEGVSPSKINDALSKCEAILDVRRIKTGNPYCIIGPRSSGDPPRYFVYEKNDVEYVVFDLGDPVKIYQGKKPVEVVLRAVEGVIETSLWNVFSDLDLDIDLAISLAEIYAWTIDFYHFQKGDSFKIIFEEKWINGRRVGTGDIIAARMTYRKKDRYAFYFEQEDRPREYFDENGESLRKAFLKAPLKFSRISSGYSSARLHPVLNTYKPHLGIDYAAPSGTPVLSVGDGRVEKAEYNKTAGNFIQIRHNSRYMTQYLHLSKFMKKIHKGARVRQGDVIGYVGSTGLSTGSHLDFRFWVNGRAVNFLDQDIPSADPVSPDYLPEFLAGIASLKTDLDSDKIRKFTAEAVPGHQNQKVERVWR